jgi:hypothetical protein
MSLALWTHQRAARSKILERTAQSGVSKILERTRRSNLMPAYGRPQTLQVRPSQPIETTPRWRITGTSRCPFESLSISSMSAALTFTFR